MEQSFKIGDRVEAVSSREWRRAFPGIASHGVVVEYASKWGLRIKVRLDGETKALPYPSTWFRREK